MGLSLVHMQVSHHARFRMIEDVTVIHPHARPFIKADSNTHRGVHRDVHRVLPLGDTSVVEHLKEVAMQVKRVIERRVVRECPNMRLAEVGFERSGL